MRDLVRESSGNLLEEFEDPHDLPESLRTSRRLRESGKYILEVQDNPRSEQPYLGFLTFLIESLRKRTSLSLGAPELQMDDFLIRILNETDHSEPGGSRASNG